MPLVDLYAIHEEKAKDGLLTVHPSRWLYAGRHGGGVFDIFASEPEAVQIGSSVITHFKGLAGANLDDKIRHKHGYYLASLGVAERYRFHVYDRTGPEGAVRDMLAINLSESRIEVQTPVGRIDLLCQREIVEVKRWVYWKDALGQVLAYSCYHPTHAKVIHLIGNTPPPASLAEVARICTSHYVVLRYQSLLSSDLGPTSRAGAVSTANPSFKRTRLRRPA